MKPGSTIFLSMIVLGIILSPNIASAFLLSVATNHVSCNGANDGSATANTTGTPVTGLIGYQWSNGATTKTINNLAPGLYSVTVSYANKTRTASVAIVEPAPLSAAMSTSKVCVGSCNGSASLSISGGTPPYTRLWSNGAAGNSLNNLCAGTYTVTITDARGCVTVVSGIVAASTFAFNVQTTPAGCVTLGSASVTVLNDTPPFSFQWSHGANTASVSNLAPGGYTVSVTNAMGCTAATSVSIVPAPALSVVGTGGSYCGSQCIGTASANATGGIPPYSFSWSNGQFGSNIAGLCAGNYVVTVWDNSGCSAQTTVTVTNNEAPFVSAYSTNVTCGGLCNGSAYALVNEGVVAYQWSTGAVTSSISGLCPGIYGVTAVNAAGCSASATTVVTQPTELLLNLFAISPSGEICNGFVSANVTGGVTPYSYSWSYNNATSSSINGLCGGTYSVTVTDANGCVVTASTVLSQDPPVVSLSSTNVNCFGFCTGAITAFASGSQAPYSYLWSTGATTSSISSLCPGQYTVTVTSSSGLSVAAAGVVLQPSQLLINVNGIPPLSGCTGGISATATGGISPYRFVLNGIDTFVNNISGLCPGIYTVVVIDAVGCTASGAVILSGPSLSLSTTGSVVCTGSCEGTVLATVSGGTPPYAYQWSNSAVTQSQAGLCPGSYGVTVVDGAGSLVTGIAYVLESNGCRDEQLETAMEAFSLYPNPTSGSSTLSFNNDVVARFLLQLSDVTGRIIWTSEFKAIMGSNNISIDVCDYPVGIYLLQLRGTDTQTVFKLLRQ